MLKKISHTNFCLFLLLCLLCNMGQSQVVYNQNSIVGSQSTTFSNPPCDLTLTTFTGVGITNVTLNTINNTSNAGGDYDFTSVSTDLEQGQSYNLSVSIEGGAFNFELWAFFDWDQDVNGTFEDDYDIATALTGTTSASTTINVPAGATLGNSRMRIVLVNNDTGINPPCDPNGNVGEVEDYTINVIVGPEPELFITEISHPFDANSSKFVEIYNAGVTSIDFDVIDYYIIREANVGNGTPPGVGSFYNSVKLFGEIKPKSYYVVSELDRDDFNAEYNTSYMSTDPDRFSQAINGDGNDTYALTTDSNGTNSTLIDNQGINSTIDIFGEYGINGFSGINTCSPSNCSNNNDGTSNDAPWEYENSRAYRNNPTVKSANDTWDSGEWQVDTDGATAAEMTPGYGDNDYIYDGDWNNNIYLSANPNGVTEPNRNIFVKSGTVTFNLDTEIGDLVVRSGATLELAPNVKLTVNGDIVNEGTIIFDSDATGTAVLETLPSSSRVVGNGFEVRRFIPVVQSPDPIRAFRYLSSSVTTTTSIFENWQQNGLNPGDPGYEAGNGTHITGALGAVGNISSDGFDETETGNPSMFSWDSSGQDWNPIPSTNNINDTFSAGDAYAILIRGDRSSTLSSNTETGPSTTLRTTGELHYGPFIVGSSDLAGQNFFSLLGNPFQSQINLKALLTGSNSNDLSPTTVYYWDPTLGVLGANVTIDLTETDINNQAVPNTSNANQYLQPQQAFFVESTGPSPSLTFTEGVKDNGTPQTSVFSTNDNVTVPSQLDITLKAANGKTYDGLRIVYDNTFANAIDQYDATKFWNYTDNLSVLSNGNYLSIEKRNIPLDDDVTPLYFGSQSLESYTFEIIFTAASFNAYLVDHYTGQTTAIPVNTMFNYNFTVDPNIPESLASDRFELTYDNSTLSVADLSEDAFSVYPNPLSSNQLLYIQSNADFSANIESIELLNLNGQILKVYQALETDFSDSLSQIQLKGQYNSGTYLLKIQTEQTTSIYKIIVH